jgi:uncharacterized protein YbjT (DUF2867 family)
MENQNKKIIAVVGATGNQGGAVLQHLVKNGWQIRALTRDSSSEKSQKLLLYGSSVKLVEVDLENKDSLRVALTNVYGVFSMTTFDRGLDAEVLHGKNVALIAKETGVQHFIFSSVGSAHLQTGVPHFESKFKIEEYIRELEIPATIVRPTYVMNNFLWFPNFREGIINGELAMAMPSDKLLQMIDIDDLGGVVAAMFEYPSRYIGKAVDIAGDELNMDQIVKIFSKKLNREVKFQSIPLEEIRKMGEDPTKMFRFFSEVGYSANLDSVRQIYPEMHSFEKWVDKASF